MRLKRKETETCKVSTVPEDLVNKKFSDLSKDLSPDQFRDKVCDRSERFFWRLWKSDKNQKCDKEVGERR